MRRIVSAAVLFLLALGTAVAQIEEVYVTRTGSKYHRAGCSSLRASAIEMRRPNGLRMPPLPLEVRLTKQCVLPQDGCTFPRTPRKPHKTSALPRVAPPGVTVSRCPSASKRGHLDPALPATPTTW